MEASKCENQGIQMLLSLLPDNNICVCLYIYTHTDTITDFKDIIIHDCLFLFENANLQFLNGLLF